LRNARIKLNDNCSNQEVTTWGAIVMRNAIGRDDNKTWRGIGRILPE